MSKKINKRAERELKKISKTTETLSELLINYQYDWKNEGSVFDLCKEETTNNAGAQFGRLYGFLKEIVDTENEIKKT